MNLYELNELIDAIPQDETYMREYYISRRKELMAELSVEIQAIIDNQE